MVVCSQELAPHTSPIFVIAFRLLPAGVALVAWAAASGRKQPKGWEAWLACAIFGLVDGTAFQVPLKIFCLVLHTIVCHTLRGVRHYLALCSYFNARRAAVCVHRSSQYLSFTQYVVQWF